MTFCYISFVDVLICYFLGVIQKQFLSKYYKTMSSLGNEEREFYLGTFTLRPRVVETFAVYHCVKTQPLIETLTNLVKAFYRYFEPETVTKFDSFTNVSSDSDGLSNHSDQKLTLSKMPQKLVIVAIY